MPADGLHTVTIFVQACVEARRHASAVEIDERSTLPEARVMEPEKCKEWRWFDSLEALLTLPDHKTLLFHPLCILRDLLHLGANTQLDCAQ